MKRFILLFILILLPGKVSSQTVEETYPKTLWCENDSFALKFKGGIETYRYCVSTNDDSPGTDAETDIYTMLYYGKDSIKLSYNNHIPYAQIIYINLQSPKGKSTLRFHYNEKYCYFTDDYIKKNEGKVQFNIPVTYELANIIWMLSPTARRDSNLDKKSEYYKRVASYFKPFLNHPVFKHLDFPDSIAANKYYEFRENSFAFNFSQDPKRTQLLFNGPYYHVYGHELADSSLFGKLKPLVEDFAFKSNFKQFYDHNQQYYQQLIAKEDSLMPVKGMWNWLEEQFSNKYQSYRVVFSPLIGGSHSTQNYHTRHNDKLFGETVMFVCGPDRVNKKTGLTEKMKEATMSGVVFTEIDHNYVNSVSYKFKKQIDPIFTKAVWSTKQSFYDNPMSVFNEYMTWAVFSLWLQDTYDAKTAGYIISEREKQMVEKRKFIRFKEFDQALIKIRNTNKDKKIESLYPEIIEWCKTQI